MEVRVYNYETKALLSTFFMKGKAYKNVFSTLGMIEALQRTRDILGVGILGKASFGIKTMYTRGCLVSSMDPDSTYVITGHYSCELRPKPKEEDTTPPNTTIDGVDTGIKVGVVMYDPGWILNTGEQSYNFFGVGSPAYMKSIGTREIISGSASSARKFKSIDSVLGYIEKNRSAFDYTVKELGYVWSVEPSCSFFQMNYEDSLTERKRRKHQEDMLTLQGLLDEVNNQVQPVVPDTSNIPEKVTPGSIRDEILYRMKKQSILKENVAVFKRTGEIFQSEAGGVIYTLDEGAQIAVDEARKHGLHPWHVIKNVYKEIGVIYSVLYVSEDTDAWPDERRSRDGIQMAFCWNADQEFADIGTIQTASAIGGLVRVAGRIQYRELKKHLIRRRTAMIRTTIKDRETNAKMFMETVGNFSKIFAIHIHRNHGGRCQFVYYPTGISGGIVIAESTVYGIEGCWIELISFLKGGIQQTTYYDDGFYDWIRKTLHWDCVYHDPEVILFKLR